ncbi:MAG: hypothetical protein KJZ68_06850, partial [Phycisphaerales bacterium]|nr:hypothetical protein [Phycisphaerales bacterium]
MTRQGIKPSEPLLASVTRAGIGTWVGAISFEERCLGSLEHLVQTGSRVRRVVALDYSTTTAPGGEGEERRELHWGRMRELASGLHAEECVRRPVNPYSFADIVDALEAEAGALATRQVPLILDITCLTKIHAVAAGVCLANLDKAERNWLSAYTSPRSFCDLTSMDRRFGWRDILIVPLVEGARLYNEASGRGLIVLGHEQDRLVVALREMQPGGGTIILPWEPTRPDLRYVMERNNRYVVRELAPHTVAGWRKKQVQLGD